MKKLILLVMVMLGVSFALMSSPPVISFTYMVQKQVISVQKENIEVI
jgi:hypothetical protein